MSNTRRVDAVLFDMDGVLIDSEPIHYASDLQMLDELGIKVPRSYLDRFVGMTNPEMWEIIRREHGITEGTKDILDRQIAVKIRLLQEGDYPAIPGVTGLLRGIRRLGVPVAVASSSSVAFIQAVLRKTGLDGYIRDFVSGEDVPAGKPAPDVYLKAAEVLGADPGACVVVEDSRNGVLAGKRAGMKVVGYRNPSSGEQDLGEADMIIDSFIECPPEAILGMMPGRDEEAHAQ